MKQFFAVLCLPVLLAACAGSGDSANDDASDASAIDITDVEFSSRLGSCADYVNSYASSVEDVQRLVAFSGSLVISLDNDTCTLQTNAIPNHDFNQGGNFATPVSAQSKTYQLDASPSRVASTTSLILGDNGLFLNGVKLDILPAACYDVGGEPLGQEKIGCGMDQIDHPWRYDPMSNLNTFGTDANNAHTQPDGTYHYHGNPMAMFDQECESSGFESPVIGFAADGFPIYGPCFDDNGTVRRATSSYALKDGGGTRQAESGYTTPVAGQGAIASNNYDGQFRGDWEYVAGSGDLDECNGMTIDGQYGYYVTDAFPWVMNCFRGTADTSF